LRALVGLGARDTLDDGQVPFVVSEIAFVHFFVLTLASIRVSMGLPCTNPSICDADQDFQIVDPSPVRYSIARRHPHQRKTIL
jgi:hypothetical protein